jgi:hypothetical protein
MSHITDEIRTLLIIRAFSGGSLYPVNVDAVHTVSYLADALAAVWGITPLEDTVLKTGWIPRSAKLQAAIDSLIGRGMVDVSTVDYEQRGNRLDLTADYSLNLDLCSRVIAAIDRDPDWQLEFQALREIATCAAGMGRDRLPRAVLVDASYSDPLLDTNTVLNLEPDEGQTPTRTERANRELSRIATERIGRDLSPAELTNLYIRHLFPLTESAS